MINGIGKAFLDLAEREMAHAYYRTVRLFRQPMISLGVLRYLEAKRDNRLFFYLRSIFSIWDPEDLVRLDLPWWTLGATKVVDDYLRSIDGGAVVFEFGGGASTAWLAKRCATIYTLDHDPEWTRRTARLCEAFTNATYLTRPPDPYSEHSDGRFVSEKAGFRGATFRNYVESINSVGQIFDLIVIDGRCRPASLLTAKHAIKDSGIILFDDSRRKRYQRPLIESGLHLNRYCGLAPGAPVGSEMSILTPRSN